MCGCGEGLVPFGRIIGIVCGLSVGFLWSVEIFWRMSLLEEQDGAVVGVFLLLPSGPVH